MQGGVFVCVDIVVCGKGLVASKARVLRVWRSAKGPQRRGLAKRLSEGASAKGHDPRGWNGAGEVDVGIDERLCGASIERGDGVGIDRNIVPPLAGSFCDEAGGLAHEHWILCHGKLLKAREKAASFDAVELTRRAVARAK